MAKSPTKSNTVNETRQTIVRDPTNPESHLGSGYEGDDTSDEISIPACGIEESDIALFNLFDKSIGFSIKNISSENKNIAIKKPFVIFATGERFALAKRLRPPRDKNSTLMLPAISIRRTSITQSDSDITGRGINQFTGTLTIKRQLAKEDRDYQNFINKSALKHMTELPTTSRTTGEEGKDVDVYNGGLLAPKLGNNIWEFITIPQPQYFTATYEVIFWTNYAQHMNYLIETYISSFLPQVRGHKLGTEKGYWFMAYTEDNFGSQENFDDFTEDHRILRYSFNVSVKGFILATNHETNMVPCRRWISSPNVTFESLPTDDIHTKKHIQQVTKNQDKFILSDLEANPTSAQNTTTNQKYTTTKQVWDPKTKRYVLKTVSILGSNQKKGETVFYAEDQNMLKDFIKELNKK